jgi:hypothetical protein
LVPVDLVVFEVSRPSAAATAGNFFGNQAISARQRLAERVHYQTFLAVVSQISVTPVDISPIGRPANYRYQRFLGVPAGGHAPPSSTGVVLSSSPVTWRESGMGKLAVGPPSVGLLRADEDAVAAIPAVPLDSGGLYGVVPPQRIRYQTVSSRCSCRL